MARKIGFDYKKAQPFLSENEILMQKDFVGAAHNLLESKTGAGHDFLVWADIPVNYDNDEF